MDNERWRLQTIELIEREGLEYMDWGVTFSACSLLISLTTSFNIFLIYSCHDCEALVKAMWSGWRGLTKEVLQVDFDVDLGFESSYYMDSLLSDKSDQLLHHSEKGDFN
eukprot:TRINITY_DN5537_c1_g1_i3.p2 TRINITY_DN5537_c1_g1~~TRINITY_DN5537_c1_g1_i3.p2  ORF type:complete len:109 (+),score=13.75 TRINITY_DN5537_c1_g1_i3:314-640(+)